MSDRSSDHLMELLKDILVRVNELIFLLDFLHSRHRGETKSSRTPIILEDRSLKLLKKYLMLMLEFIP